VSLLNIAEYGNDINDYTSPLEAGLGWITKFTKNFIYSVFLKIQKERGVVKKLLLLKLMAKASPAMVMKFGIIIIKLSDRLPRELFLRHSKKE